ncbi:MAG: tRNA (adenosine(37)-N6)-threonylcarbamoyltransferase complex ATPase subunit type 1 TsaE [Candidatus Omnitrophota bacterium]
MIANSVKDTLAFGRRLAHFLEAGDVVALTGDLGSGKTTFTKGIAAGLKVSDPEYVNSPSFVLVKEYKGRLNLYHFDLYRLDRMDDMEYIGISEYMDGDGVVVIEWANKLKGLLPSEYLEICINIAGKNKRKLELKAHGEKYLNIIRGYIKQ